WPVSSSQSRKPECWPQPPTSMVRQLASAPEFSEDRRESIQFRIHQPSPPSDQPTKIPATCQQVIFFSNQVSAETFNRSITFQHARGGMVTCSVDDEKYWPSGGPASCRTR